MVYYITINGTQMLILGHRPHKGRYTLMNNKCIYRKQLELRMHGGVLHYNLTTNNM